MNLEEMTIALTLMEVVSNLLRGTIACSGSINSLHWSLLERIVSTEHHLSLKKSI